MTTTAALRSADLLAADPLLPARDDLFDTAWVCRRLRTIDPAGRTFEPGRLVRAKYRIGESVRAVHEIVVDGRPTIVTGRTFPNGGGTAARRSPDALHDTVHGTVWWIFPDDRRLVGAAAVMDADRTLASRLGVTAWTSSAVAELAPERSLTVRADDAAGRVVAYVKLYAPGTVDVGRFAARYDAARAALQPLPTVSVPRVIGSTDTAIAITPVPGVPWTGLGRAHALAMLGALGEAIARFHTIEQGGLAGRFARLQVPRVVHSAELVALARPELAPALLEIADVLSGGPPADDEHVLLHGDCHPRNSLIDGDRLGLIDLDQAGVGSPACDIASLIARVRHGVVLGQATAGHAAALEHAFLDGYARHRSLPSEESIRWHVVAAYVAERAIRAVNRVNLPALAGLDGLVTIALDAARALPTRRPPSRPTRPEHRSP